jgi:hypothetical protein
MSLGQHRNLQNEHGDARGGDGKKRLPESFDQIDVVAHVNAPLTESQQNAPTATASQIGYLTVR